MLTWIKNNLNLSSLLVVLSGVFYHIFAYAISREDYLELIVLYATLFFLFYRLIASQAISEKRLVQLSFVFRALLLFAIPNLSQDFYRFIWDGRIALAGINPYLNTPLSYFQDGIFPIAQGRELYEGMGSLSAKHYTNYPPLNQLCFAIAALFAGKSILGSAVVLRLIIIAADYGTYHYGKKLLANIGLPTKKIFWYLLNPFIILELTGNLHFEGVMIFFMIWSLYQLASGNWKKSAVLLACSISIKLIPLMFLPIFYRFLGFKKLFLYGLIVGLTSILLFAPFLSTQFINNYSDTVGLWFQNFEFNASLYYVARAIGYYISGYNEIAIIGKTIPLVVVLFIMAISFSKKRISVQHVVQGMLIALSFYFFTATTVHPWYISTLLVLSLFTSYKFPLVWSFVIILSYLSYSSYTAQENLWIVFIEYAVVYGYLAYELLIKKHHTVRNEPIL